MSTHKRIDKICCVVLAVTLVLTILFMNADSFKLQKTSVTMGYENRLFDTSRVHSINIIMDDWDEFTANCQNEEYSACTVVIDNDAYKNVAIRGKGNTSLTQVASYGNNRYSFKIEFDRYNSTNTYYGLDKLCLNNIIQDNTYMKDYLCYQMMRETGVAAPLCSFVYITVNGEDWGLYLAVEGVEESFLQRNYGKNYGELYKPDSTSLGGGRGNGKDFDTEKFANASETESSDSDNTSSTQNSTAVNETQSTAQEQSATEKATAGSQTPDSNMPGGNTPNPNAPNGQMPNPNAPGGRMPDGMTPPTDNGNVPFGGQMPEGMTPPESSGNTDGSDSNGNGKEQNGTTNGNAPEAVPRGDKGGGMMNGSDDVLLKYIDDEFESYSNIFDNAKTAVSDADKSRLINALKNLSNGEDLTGTLDVDAVIRYFVVHNFVLNFDSYTGSLIHNYYLYESNGQMQMIPWDYNLAFGGFGSAGEAANLVNYPIDSPVSGGNVEDRPMIAWIFNNEEYTELYHKYFSEFISEYFDSGYFEEMIDKVTSLIAPYVEKDPTKFCTYEEFEAGAATLKEFCLLRAKSISGQLDGTIGSTTETQKSDTLIDAGNIQISAMGSMRNSMGGGMTRPDNNMQNLQSNGNTSGQTPPTENNADNSGSQAQPSTGDSADAQSNENGDNSILQTPDGKSRQKNVGQSNPQPQTSVSPTSLITLAISIAVLVLGIIFAFTYKRRK